MQKFIDLRSDTVTQPTQAMRQAMAEAPVGDDVFGEDPTVNEIQNRVAEMCGKEAALFVPSGTMGNQTALKTHTQPGDEIICEYGAHIFNYEGGAPGLLSGAQIYPVPGKRGVITAEQIEKVIRKPNAHFPNTRVIEIENTHNRAGGAIFPLDEIKKIVKVAQQHKLKMHLDGARLWNAHVATGVAFSDYCSGFDSISLCFSKGLGAPVGSIVVGSQSFIQRAHRFRKIFGGGMRQVGILAAAALYALDHHIGRLAEDHQRAAALARCLAECGAEVDMHATQTNIVIADFESFHLSAPQLAKEFENQGVLCIAFSDTRIRFVTHLDITDDSIEKTCQVTKNLLC